MRRKGTGHENHERWLVSYADFITLLFAFFVVMFASTQADKKKAKAVSDSVRQALEHGQFSSALSSVLGRGKHETPKPATAKDPANGRETTPPPSPPESHPPDLAKSLSTLQEGLKAELINGKLQLKLEPRGLVISMREATFFASGDNTVAPASLPILAKIAEVVQSLPNPVRFEGHTDSVPIHNSRFHSNWELSSARSISMLELFRDHFQIPDSRMAVAGYADNAPADTNETEEGRAHNRRVDLVLLTTSGMAVEPQAGPGSRPAQAGGTASAPSVGSDGLRPL